MLVITIYKSCPRLPAMPVTMMSWLRRNVFKCKTRFVIYKMHFRTFQRVLRVVDQAPVDICWDKCSTHLYQAPKREPKFLVLYKQSNKIDLRVEDKHTTLSRSFTRRKHYDRSHETSTIQKHIALEPSGRSLMSQVSIICVHVLRVFFLFLFLLSLELCGIYHFYPVDAVWNPGSHQ